jgi:hypothetical protein
MMKLKYTLLLWILFIVVTSDKIYAQDSVKVKEPSFTYFKIGVDVANLISSPLSSSRSNYEFQLEAYYKKSLSWVIETGFGSSSVKSEKLTYTSRNQFIRLGVDQTFFNKEFKGDFDNAFVGVRYGLSRVQRNAATYFIEDAIWGNQQGVIDANKFTAHWIELTGGFRMELVKHVFAGWNIRMKTLLNPKRFEQLPPGYMAGYGRGDKNTAFSYNLYVLYGFGKRR